ncbi:MAG TPA: diacylglycerol kinase family protein [Firmicutes bacterium]|jgi:diacylglycerol kinase|nr:diacylglycerol kinase family protein [Bacillota bacterium]
MRERPILISFRDALRGLGAVWRAERNFRIHTAAAYGVLWGAWLLGLSFLEWVALVLTIGLVLTMEVWNTVLEAVVDLSSPEWNDLARWTKDAAAGAVFLAAAGAIATGVLVFGPRLLVPGLIWRALLARGWLAGIAALPWFGLVATIFLPRKERPTVR